MKKMMACLAAVFLLSTGVVNAAVGAEKQPAAQTAPARATVPLARNPEIQAVKPKKPVRIKIHRSPAGQYSWDISGDNPDDVYRADSRLRKLFKIEP